LPWRAAEAMHWQIGEPEMASRANVPVFHLAGQPAASTPPQTSASASASNATRASAGSAATDTQSGSASPGSGSGSGHGSVPPYHQQKADADSMRDSIMKPETSQQQHQQQQNHQQHQQHHHQLPQHHQAGQAGVSSYRRTSDASRSAGGTDDGSRSESTAPYARSDHPRKTVHPSGPGGHEQPSPAARPYLSPFARPADSGRR